MIILFVIFSTFINFPFLWENPLQNSLEVFQKLSNHSWRGNVLYFGKYYKSIELPWHYILSWYFLTTPITYSLIFLFTVIFAVRKIYDGGLSNIKKNIITHKYFYLNFGIFIFALFLIIIFQKTKYNGWRHSYFLFIFFLYSILYFVNTINLQKIKNFIYLILILTVSLNLHWIYRNHPYQNLYFNFIIKEPYKQFDMDWWGLTNIDILKYLLNYDKSKDTVYLHSIVVESPFRKQGFGTKLVKECENIARNSGYKYITATVKKNNTPSQSMFNKLGYSKYNSNDRKDLFILGID